MNTGLYYVSNNKYLLIKHLVYNIIAHNYCVTIVRQSGKKLALQASLWRWHYSTALLVQRRSAMSSPSADVRRPIKVWANAEK